MIERNGSVVPFWSYSIWSWPALSRQSTTQLELVGELEILIQLALPALPKIYC